MMNWRRALVIGALVGLPLGCGILGGNSSGGDDNTGGGNTGGGGSTTIPKVENANFFPQGLALASPLRGSQKAVTGSLMKEKEPSFFEKLLPSYWMVKKAHAQSATYTTAFAENTQLIQGVLAGTLPAATALSPNAFTLQKIDVECYGPRMNFADHPDWVDGGTTPTDGGMPPPPPSDGGMPPPPPSDGGTLPTACPAYPPLPDGGLIVMSNGSPCPPLPPGVCPPVVPLADGGIPMMPPAPDAGMPAMCPMPNAPCPPVPFPKDGGVVVYDGTSCPAVPSDWCPPVAPLADGGTPERLPDGGCPAAAIPGSMGPMDGGMPPPPPDGGTSPGPGPGPGPSGPMNSPSGQLPTGDLGIWLEEERGTSDFAGSACAAAQLNSQLEKSSAKANAALVALATVARTVLASDAGVLSPGTSLTLTSEMNALGIPDINFTNVQFDIDASGTKWEYELRFELSVPAAPPATGTSTQDFIVRLSHAAGADLDNYSGLLSILSDDAQDNGCPPGQPSMMATTIAYSREGANTLSLSTRSAGYCSLTPATFNTSLLTADGELDPTKKADPSTMGVGWKKSFDRFGATFDPASASMAGSYAYAWQAGEGDSHSRIFNIRLNSSSADGEAYFGYGDTIDATDGSIKGFICNWAGPGNDHTLRPYAQRQFVEFDSASGKWKQPTGGSDIRYSPTNSCEYTNAQRSAGASFWYDRDLTYASSGSPSQANLIVDKTDTTYPFDLMETGSSSDITAAIAGRGFTLPSKF